MLIAVLVRNREWQNIEGPFVTSSYCYQMMKLFSFLRAIRCTNLWLLLIKNSGSPLKTVIIQIKHKSYKVFFCKTNCIWWFCNLPLSRIWWLILQILCCENKQYFFTCKYVLPESLIPSFAPNDAEKSAFFLHLSLCSLSSCNSMNEAPTFLDYNSLNCDNSNQALVI